MLLSQLIAPLKPLEVVGPCDVEFTGISCDSRKVSRGDLFCAARGGSHDGHRFIDQALAGGAAALIVEDAAAIPEGVNALVVRDGRVAMAAAAACYYAPSGPLPSVGITGTNGKTTTSYLTEALLRASGRRPAVIGTISYRLEQFALPAANTTPGAVELQKTLRQLADAGADCAVMEVSSHALEQQRVAGCHFSVGIFTNLTRDHLDYHLDMEQYYNAKKRLFEMLQENGGTGVINLDDPYGARLAQEVRCRLLGYGESEQAQVRASEVRSTAAGIEALVDTPLGSFRLTSALVGRFNLSNLLAAIAAGVALGLPLETISTGIAGHLPVPGRLERIANDRDVTCLVDYAHTGDALENVLTTLRGITRGRIITVFGCGGDRDRGKRAIMGETAGRLSDISIITSDNPRSEDPLQIIGDIRAGIDRTGLAELDAGQLGGPRRCFSVIPDRREAIRCAIACAIAGDTVLLAGKGHEDYQIVGATKHHFDDREEARLAFRTGAA